MRGFFAPAWKPDVGAGVNQRTTLCHIMLKEFLIWELVDITGLFSSTERQNGT
ncbi:MAG: hypothetical protein IPK53_06250 [bacterium]|nr:hypothetical protein [bacterium]